MTKNLSQSTQSHLTRRMLLAGLGAVALSTALPAVAATTTTYGYLNLTRARYTAGLKAGGVSIDWSARRKRAAAFLSTTIRASIYGLTETDDFMAADLAKSFGTNWKRLGFDPDKHNAGGWLWDKRKWSLSSFGVFNLPGVQSRRLLTVTAKHLPTGKAVPLALTHLASSAPEDRDAQMAAVLSRLKGHVLVGDINASSPATEDCDSTAPRTQLACAGFTGPDFGGTFHDWSADSALALDYAGVGPGSRVTLKGTKVGTYSQRISDHDCLKLALTL